MKKTAMIISLILITILLCSCSVTGLNLSYINENQSDKLAADIAPIQNSEQLNTVTVPLYFRYYDEPMLSSETRVLNVAEYQGLEYAIVSALLQGPSAEMQELKSCISKSTRLISVSKNNNYLYVTLSKEFLDLPTGISKNWQNDATQSDEVYLSRRLAIYSIVNTICDLGTYSKVQIYIDTKDSGNGERMLRKDMGFIGDGDEDQPLEPLSRNVDYILTPVNSVRAALKYYSMKKWDKVYNYLGDDAQASAKKPILEEYVNSNTYENLTLTDYIAVDGYTVSKDGNRAIVQVSFKLKSKNTSFVVDNVPLVLIRERECWKISYESFIGYLKVQ